MYSEYDQIDLLSKDYFGTRTKVEVLLNMLRKRDSLIYQNRMIALYGKWGSGKSTVLQTVSNNCKECNFIFFEAWKYESDENLSLSLFHMIMEKIERVEGLTKKTIKNLKEVSETLFKYSYNLLMTSEINVGFLKISPGQAGSDTLEELTKEQSYYQRVKEFEELFVTLISEYVGITKKPLIIMIDDLDRCEPENVLSLLSNIKHLFITDDLCYICAIDKKAVENSINIKYGKNIDYIEYLDKLFNFNISMPNRIDVSGIVDDFQEKFTSEVVSDDTKELIVNFLEHIRMNNPRKIRKVLSKFTYIKEIQPESKYQESIEVYNFDSFNIILWLFTIIVFEFYPEYYKDIINFKTKLEKFRSLTKTKDNNVNIASNRSVYIEDFYKLLSDDMVNTTIDYGSIRTFTEGIDGSVWDRNVIQLICLLMPSDVNEFTLPDFRNRTARYNQLFKLIGNAHFSKYDIAFRFLEYYLITCNDPSNLKEFQAKPYEYFEFAEKYF